MKFKLNCVICGQELTNHTEHPEMCLFALHDTLNKIGESQKVLAKFGLVIKVLPGTVS